MIQIYAEGRDESAGPFVHRLIAAARPAVGSIVTRTPLPAEVDESRFVERCAELVVVKGIEHSARVLRGWNPRQMSFRAFLTLLARVVVERELA